MAEMWPASQSGDRRGRHLWAALGVSLLVHALVLFAMRGWRADSPPSPPLMVTMLERGGGGGAAAGGGGESAPAPVAALAPAAVALPALRKVAPARPLPRRAATTPPAAEPSTTSAALAPEASVPSLPSIGTEGRGSADGGGGAPGAGEGTEGAGGGAGAGSDGLRAFCRSCPAPDYPARARRQGWQGSVAVDLAIGRDGAVAEARVGHSSGFPTLDEVALAVARQSHFTVPAGGAGLRGQLRYRFVLDEAAARR